MGLVKLTDRLGMPQEQYARRYGVTTLICNIGNGLFYPFSLLYFHHQLDASLATVGLCLTVATGVGALAASQTGKLADRFGGRDVLVAAALVRVVILACYPLVESVAVFGVLAAVVAVANRTDQVSGQTIISLLAPEESRPRWFALSRMTLNAGTGAGSLVGGLVITSPIGYDGIVLANAATFAIVALLYLTFPSGKVPADRADEKDGGVWRDRLFIKFAALNGLWMVIALSVEIGMPVFLVLYLDQPAWMVSVVFILNTAMVTLFQLPMGRAVQGRPPMHVLRHGIVVYAVSFALLYLTDFLSGAALVAILVGAVAVFTVGEMLVSTIGMTVINALAPEGRTGAYVGVSWTFAGVGSALAPTVFTVALEVSPSLLWAGLTLLSVGMVVVTVRLTPPIQGRLARPSAAPVTHEEPAEKDG